MYESRVDVNPGDQRGKQLKNWIIEKRNKAANIDSPQITTRFKQNSSLHDDASANEDDRD